MFCNKTPLPMKQFYFPGILFFALFLCVSPVFYAQVGGVLKDSVSQSPVAFANIGLMRLADSVLLKGASSDENGKFTFNGVKSGDYLLRVSCIGYQSLWQRIEVKGRTNLNDILLVPSSRTLGEVEIVEKRPLFSMDGEKTVYNVEDDPLIQTGTTNDALQNAPGVSVDVEGNITLEGVSCVEIWLNDEPSKIKSHNLKTFLDNLPANALKRIEVITHPGAKYAGTSGCGVINIVTNTRIKSNHFISFGSGTNSFWDLSPFVSYVWANEKVSFSVYASTNIRNRSTSEQSRSASFKDNASAGKDTLYTETTRNENENKSFGGWFSVDFDYKIDSMSELSLWGGFDPNWTRTLSGGERSRFDFVNSPSTAVSAVESYYESMAADTSFSAWGKLNARYRKNFDKEGHRLSISLNGDFSPSAQRRNQTRQYTPASPLYDNLNKQYTTDKDSYGIRFATRYTKPFCKRRELSCGVSFDWDNDRSIRNTKAFDSTASAFNTVDSLRSYNKTTGRADLRGFADWREKFGNFTLQFGLNAELNRSSFVAENDCFADDTAMSYLALRPNIRLSYRTETMYDFSVSYSYSSSVPELSSRTSFREYTEDSYSVGNADLQRTDRHSLSVNCDKFFMGAGYIMLSLSSDWSNNSISSVTDLIWDDYMGRYVHYSKPYNSASSSSQNLWLMGNIRLGAFANLNLNGSLSRSVYELDYTDGKHYREEGFKIRTMCNIWARFCKNYQVYMGGAVLIPGKTLFSSGDNVYNLNFGLGANFFDRKLSVSLSVSDPFNWNKITSDITAPNYHSRSTAVRNSRYISFNLTLRFGKLELENKQTSSSSAGSR